jgi:uncharacterized protein with FMN-binding domain
MRRIALWMASTVVLVVLLFGYHTSLEGPTRTTASAPTQAPGVVSTRPSPGSAGSGQAPSSSRTIVNGSVADTVYGPVQIQIQTSGHKITDVRILIAPSGSGRDQEINSYALPILRRETLAAQSADIQAVSGATYTSDGYRRSLQAALDAAHLGQ